MSSYDSCPRSDWNDGRRQCPYSCGVDCKRNAQHQRNVGRKLEKCLANLTRDDWEWLYGVGRYSHALDK